MNRLSVMVVLAAVLGAGCASVPAGSEMVEVVAPRTVDLEVAGGELLELRVSAGEVAIVGSDDNAVRATLSIKCPAGSRGCAKWAERARLAAARGDGRVRLALEAPARIKAETKLEVQAPRHSPLQIVMGYGELRARDLESDVSVEMKAGEVDIQMPSRAVENVQLAARFGDASMRIDGEAIEGERPWLVGAKVAWREGRGSHDVNVRLRYGDVRVSLQ